MTIKKCKQCNKKIEKDEFNSFLDELQTCDDCQKKNNNKARNKKNINRIINK